MSHDEDSQQWIDKVMPKIIETLGPDVDETRYELFKNLCLIASTVYHVHLQFKNKTNDRNEELFMILKRPGRDFYQQTCIEPQFHNEILFYRNQSDERYLIYPRCIYAAKLSPTDAVIALENVNKRGYYACPYPYNPPLEYTLAAMRELGRFHGKGYVMKELQREKFYDIVARRQEVRFVKMGNLYEEGIKIMGSRAVEYLRSQGHDAVFCNKMEALLTNAFDEVMMKVVKPLEPLSTLCHGDFMLSNILFNKAEEDGQCRAMLIDFALITYSTPVIDLSTYLCLCCSNEERREKFSDIMRAYHDALMEYLLDADIQDIEKYSYDALLDDWRRGALFGFLIMSIYLPTILGYAKPRELIQKLLQLGIIEGLKKQKCLGGDEVNKILADALLHLQELGCLKHFL
ncbi:PREDICTED: uncharacterized protein LOC105450164 [Wasmannia auropunctata]|uniref:uncharacterized protein LOC105450164 n=1 Tax=Wasmannia auropunctata TaxID=64793 RepID=UPI0005EF591B|nr:PREDICTED: uncharacterized protein LOC105450164 [Wasmannia auropunctata]